MADRSSAELSDIGVGNGRIVAIERRLAADAEVYDAEGRLACPGLIESHIHLDKSRIMDRCAPQERAQLSPIKGVAPLKKSTTVEDIRARAERTLQLCILHGTTRMRTQVEVDPGIGMRGFDAVASLARDYKWAIDIEICVFPQEGLTNYPGTDELLVQPARRSRPHAAGKPLPEVVDVEVSVAAGKAANLEGERPLPSIARIRTASISDARGGNKPRCART